MTNKNHTTLYTGVTSNLPKRVQQHKESYYSQSFTSRYNLYILVYGKLFRK
ncbi:GIY-YIG nuclease family protein [Chryseobacterium rhizoplanae]|uniref:GIY-YIG nuclease family protein n=1 Tax=Chryseobacterium rhizoplanae TaxID=1609531 RepID=UPI002938D30C|nr:GIY-YIG nuclease family protein [Chryseobacterium rhizoplanae]